MGNTIPEKVQEVTPKRPEGDEDVYVSIPQTDLYEYDHPGVRLNRVKFEAGKTYKVPAPVGAEVEDRLKMFHKEQIRLLRPRADMRSVNQVNAGSAWSTGGGGIVGSAEQLEKSLGAKDKIITINW